MMRKMLAVAAGCMAMTVQGGDGPSFDCNALGEHAPAAQRLVCQDAELAALDIKLAKVFQQAAAKATNEHPPLLKAEQRGWIKGRDECWKNDDVRACVFDSYRIRIAELQARYRLVLPKGPVYWNCGSQGELVINFFDTDPATLIAERGDSVSLMFASESGSGIRYQGRNESFWEHQGEAKVVWGYGTEPFKCQPIK